MCDWFKSPSDLNPHSGGSVGGEPDSATVAGIWSATAEIG
jgi:hypothetical protein